MSFCLLSPVLPLLRDLPPLGSCCLLTVPAAALLASPAMTHKLKTTSVPPFQTEYSSASLDPTAWPDESRNTPGW